MGGRIICSLSIHRRSLGADPVEIGMMIEVPSSAIMADVFAAEAAGKWVGACGGVAGDPLGVVILTGLVVSELSVSIPSIAAVKAQIRNLSRDKARALAERALACRTAAEVRSLAS